MSGIILNIVGMTSTSVPGAPTIGAAFGGGFFAGQISTAGNGIADYNLVVGPVASAENELTFKGAFSGGDPTSVINGPANSAAMNSALYPAALFCEGLTIGGFSDWYMPAKNELEVCYYNLKPTTQTNNTAFGINVNAVPARASNYTAGNPAQTSSTDFRSTGAEDFASTGLCYWTSTQASTATEAFGKYFSEGTGNSYGKVYARRVRAIRRVAV